MFCQAGHGRVIAVQPLGGQNMGLDQGEQRFDRHTQGTDLIGKYREAHARKPSIRLCRVSAQFSAPPINLIGRYISKLRDLRHHRTR